MRYLLVLLLFLGFGANAQTGYAPTCLSAHRYLVIADDRNKWVDNLIVLCWDTRTVSFWVNGERTALRVDDYRKSAGQGGFMEELIFCGEREWVVLIRHTSPVSVSICYTRFGGFTYGFKSDGLPAIREVVSE